MTELLEQASEIIWGPYLLIPLLLVTGLFLTIRLRGVQFWRLGRSLHTAFIVRSEAGSPGDITHYQALMTALAATVGTGNIVGVATAIALGGPGALFWMWMTGLVGMATKYCEALLSVKYRGVTPRGEQAGGPMYYLSRGIANPVVGRVLGWSFALFAAIAAFGIGNMVQSNAVASAMEGAFGALEWVTGGVIAILLALVVLGGIRWIAHVTGVLVPVMVVIYMMAVTIVLVANYQAVPGAFVVVVREAFTGTAAVGGFAGAAIAQAIRYGVARGIFSNESGLGTGGIAAAAARTTEPARQAFVSMTQTFIDTLVVCSFTGIAIVSTGVWSSGETGAELTQMALDSALPGALGSQVVAVTLALFAFSTLLGWCYYGERSVEYILGSEVVVAYRVVFVAVAYIGALHTLEFVWLFADVMNGLMALPNLIGLWLLSGVAVRETRSFLERYGDTG